MILMLGWLGLNKDNMKLLKLIKLIVVVLLVATSAYGQSSGVGTIWTRISGTLQSGATASGNGTALAVGGLSSATFTVNCSVACSGGTTINFESTEDNTNYNATLALQLGTNTVATTVVNQGTTITQWTIPVGGAIGIRARISAYSAGTITVTASATAAPYVPLVINANGIAGTAVLGHVISDSGSTTAATQTLASNLNATVVGAGTAGSASGGVVTIQGVASMTKLLVTPDSVALPANQSTNVAQVAGTTADTNSGSKSAGTLRVVLATDQPALTNKLLVTPDSVALPNNQSSNISQINAVTPLMGNGVTGTGSQRVTIASDNTAFSTNATLSAETTKVIGTVRNVGNVGAAFDAATGAAPPANAVLLGGIGSGATGGFVIGLPVCDTFFNINIATATTTLAVTGVSGRHVRICHIDMVGTAADNVGIISGTGATCGTGSAAIVGTTAATGYNLAANGGITSGSGIGTIMRTVATGDSVCIITSATTQLSGVIAYTIY